MPAFMTAAFTSSIVSGVAATLAVYGTVIGGNGGKSLWSSIKAISSFESVVLSSGLVNDGTLANAVMADGSM